MITFILSFVGGGLMGMGTTRNDNRYVAAGMALFIIAMALVFV